MKPASGFPANQAGLLVILPLGQVTRAALLRAITSSLFLVFLSCAARLAAQSPLPFDGRRDDAGWSAGHGWASKAGEPLPQWLEVDFSQVRTIQRFVIITYQKDNSAETAGKWGVKNYTIEAWDKQKQKWKPLATEAAEFAGKVRVHQLANPLSHRPIPHRGHQSGAPRRLG